MSLEPIIAKKNKRGKPSRSAARGDKQGAKGQLRIGDHWNAITILALSQSNPLKAIAEFVENSIDAQATVVHIFRGKKAGQTYLRIVDNGKGIPKDESGVPDFKYVATHICNSIKRRLKASGVQGLQGEFGIGLLSFWTVGEQLTLRSADDQGHVHQLTLRKGDSGYAITKSRALLAESGTELLIQPLLAGLKNLSGEKLQWYLGMELRNRLLEGGVQVHIHDLISRDEYTVEPQKYDGTRMVLPTTKGLKAEIFVNSPAPSNQVSLFRKGTRVLENVQTLPSLNPSIWGSSYFSGFIDCDDLQLTPGTRLGMIQDEKYEALIQSLQSLEPALGEELSRLKQVEEERASTLTYSALHRAFKSAFSSLPPEEYDWFEIEGNQKRRRSSSTAAGTALSDQARGGIPGAGEYDQNQPETGVPGGTERVDELDSDENTTPSQPAFFEIAGPLYSVRISPASSLLPVGGVRKLRAVARDRKGLPITENLRYQWEIAVDGVASLATLSESDRQEVTLQAHQEPGLIKVGLTTWQGEIEVKAEAVVTITDSILSRRNEDVSGAKKGLPSFTYEREPGRQWRSRFDVSRNLIVINSGHRDFLFASAKPQLKLRYLVRLFSKELVLSNFQGLSSSDILDRQIEISLRAEEFLR